MAAEVKFNIVLSSSTPTTGTYAVGSSTLTDTKGYVYSQNAMCTNIYCHSNGQPLGGPYTTKTATWNQAMGVAPNDCSVCHGGLATSTATIATNRHNTHIGSYSMGCEKCHQLTTTTGTTITDKTHHVDGNKDVSIISNLVSTTAYDSVNHQCSNIYCHSQGTSGTTYNASYSSASSSIVAWNGAALACNGCHTGGYATGPIYANGTNGKANSHQAHVTTNKGVCNTCHNLTTTTGSTITNFANHADKTYDLKDTRPTVTFDVLVQGNFTTATQCSNISCHGGTGSSATWGGTVSCHDCHSKAGSDTDQFANPMSAVWKNGTNAIISRGEWTTTGHGRTTAYPYTSNPSASFDAAGAGTGCLYCHAGPTDPVPSSHETFTNPFRLKWVTGQGSNGVNALCLKCHSSSPAGYVIGTDGPLASKNTSTWTRVRSPIITERSIQRRRAAAPSAWTATNLMATETMQ